VAGNEGTETQATEADNRRVTAAGACEKAAPKPEAEAANPQKEPGTTCENYNSPASASQKTREALAAPCN
jgi:hypothetical protein